MSSLKVSDAVSLSWNTGSEKELDKIPDFSPCSSQSRINVLKLKEAEHCIETCCIVQSRHLIVEQRIHFVHPFFPEISSSFKAAVLVQRDFLKAMCVLSKAPRFFHHLADTWKSADDTLCSQLTLKGLIFTHRSQHPISCQTPLINSISPPPYFSSAF